MSNFDLTMLFLSGTSGTVAAGSAVLTVNQPGNTIFARSISGNNSFRKLGAGTLDLAGSSAHGGQTTVDGGTLAISNSFSTQGMHVGTGGGNGTVSVMGPGAQLTANVFMTVGDNLFGGPGGVGTLTITNGGIVTLGPGAKLTVGWINADGEVNLNSGGTLELNGTDGLQQHASGTSDFNFAGGTIKTRAAFTSSLSMNISGTTSTFNTNGVSATLSGALAGSGALTKAGFGTLTLAGSNSYSGGAIVIGGTLTRSVAAGFANDTPYMVNGGALSLNNLPLTASALSGTGGLTNLQNATLTVNQVADTTYAGSIVDSGAGSLTKSGPGTLTLSGLNTYGGPTLVNGGTLVVNGSINAAAFVATGGTLVGAGSIGGAVSISGGTLAPGASPGQLSCHGVTARTGALTIDIAGPTPGIGYDQLLVLSGAVDLGTQLSLTFGTLSGSFTASDRLYVINNTGLGSVMGAFPGLPDSGASGTPVPALANLGGFAEWRIYYHADSATNSLSGGNDVALAPAMVVANVDIVSANPPADNPYVTGQQPFRDVLDTGTTHMLTAGIGGSATQPQGGIEYGQISVTFSGTPSPAPSTGAASTPSRTTSRDTLARAGHRERRHRVHRRSLSFHHVSGRQRRRTLSHRAFRRDPAGALHHADVLRQRHR